jgi:3-hydroxy-9,10-secoandrosta-1,3,5(10)-triene-9,17-dione monooxygenase reductase component
VSIHASDPFATPDEAKSAIRRLRGRLPAAVSLWTTRHADGRPAGLTVSSTVLVDGDPGRVLGVLDQESTLWDALRDGDGRLAVAPLRGSDGQLAEIFAGLMPSPGGPFVGQAWQETPWGPVPDGVAGWAGCRLVEARQLGWSLLVEATVEQVEISAQVPAPLLHYRGRYLGGPASRSERHIV